MSFLFYNSELTNLTSVDLFSILFHSSLVLTPLYLIYRINKKTKILRSDNLNNDNRNVNRNVNRNDDRNDDNITKDTPDIIQLEDCDSNSESGSDSIQGSDSDCASDVTIKLKDQKNIEDSVNELSVKIQKIIDELSEL
jgi:hypothetical protein